MWVSRTSLNNIRSFRSEEITLSQSINVIVGPNNSGKSTILRCIYLVQEPGSLKGEDIRLGMGDGSVAITFGGAVVPPFSNLSLLKVDFSNNGIKRIGIKNNGGERSPVGSIPKNEPQNFIYPYLSKRKVVEFAENITLDLTNQVRGDLSNLYAKIDRISNAELPAYREYTQACDEILGFRVSTSGSTKGKKATYIINNFQNITIDNMGEGITNLLGLIVDLCVAENKLFLIEEPENDIHPKALKGLLSLIAKKAQHNQFVISTHSNIVMKYLGAQPKSQVIHISMGFQDRLPTSKIRVIGDNHEERRVVLEELGYELYDSDLWDGWLFLEESSAEKIIREYLIPWFVKGLQQKIRTYSAHSLDEVEPKFADFNNLFVFLHLQETYKNKVWVIVDGGDKEAEIIKKLKETYQGRGWNENNFRQFSEHDFEKYYPAVFREKVSEILSLTNKHQKREKKKALFDEVEAWISEDEKRAKAEFKKSAREVIQTLQEIEKIITNE